jgi:hypothetical protein
MLKFTLKFVINAPAACASLKLQCWRQLKYFVTELFGCVASYSSISFGVYIVHSTESIPIGMCIVHRAE